MPDARHRPEGSTRDGSVLLVSGDRPWLASATAFLVAATRSLSTAETATEAIDHAMGHPPDVVVIAPPIGDGSPLMLINQLTQLRERGALGIVYVTDRERELTEHARLMRAGTNDWFPRGLPPNETAARIAALLSEILAAPHLRAVIRGPLRLDLIAKDARVGGVSLGLNNVEFRILEALALAAGRMLTQREIATAVGARRGSQAARSIDARIMGLCDKMGAARGLLEASRRNGYRLRFVAPV